MLSHDEILARSKIMVDVDMGATVRLRIDDEDTNGDMYSTVIEIEDGHATIRPDSSDEVVIDYDDWQIDDDGVLILITEMGIGMRSELKIFLDEVAHITTWD